MAKGGEQGGSLDDRLTELVLCHRLLPNYKGRNHVGSMCRALQGHCSCVQSIVGLLFMCVEHCRATVHVCRALQGRCSHV